MFFEPGNGARGKGAAFEPSCLAQLWRSSSGVAHLLPEPVLGLLHAPRGFGVTHAFADALESRETESGT